MANNNTKHPNTPTPTQVGLQSIKGAPVSQVMPGFPASDSTSITGDNTKPGRSYGNS